MVRGSQSLKERSGSSSEDSPSSQRKKREFILFRKVQGALNHVPNFVEACKAILDAVMEETDAENCSLMLKDPVSGELTVRAARGKEERKTAYYLAPSGNGKRFKSGEGIAGWVLREGQAVMVTDTKEEPRFVKADGLNGQVRSLVCFPIREKDQVVGVFNISHSEKGAFDDGDKLALGYVSNQVGAALSSARFFIEIQEMSRLVKDPGESYVRQRMAPPIPGALNFVEVGEVTPEDGIFIYASGKMCRIKEIIDQVADTDVTVLIQGESGVGKEMVARSIYQNSSRRDNVLVKINCAALPPDLLESELFGYEKGAFTGAYRQKPGKFEQANGGTILLDEIGEISLPLQSKLLQVLQDRAFSKLGGKKDVRVNVRVIALTNQNMEEAVKTGRFREDLYYRLNVVNITVPPLRERKEEIPIFIEYFLDKFGKKYGNKANPLSDRMMESLLNHPWLGNVRELENAIQRYTVMRNEEAIFDALTSTGTREAFPEKPEKQGPPLNKDGRLSLKEVHKRATRRAETEIIGRALQSTNWNRKKAAGILNISYKALLYKMKECGFDR